MGKMKSKLLLASAIVLLIPAMAFAKPKDSANIDLSQPVTVAGTQLAPGQYKVTWEGAGSDVKVSFTEGKKTLATAPAKLVSNTTDLDNAIETNTAADNTTLLRAIDLKHITIRFENAAPGAGN
jgi:hypothetical protein